MKGTSYATQATEASDQVGLIVSFMCFILNHSDGSQPNTVRYFGYLPSMCNGRYG